MLKKIKSIMRYARAKQQATAWLKAFDAATERVATLEEFNLEVVPAFCNARFWVYIMVIESKLLEL